MVLLATAILVMGTFAVSASAEDIQPHNIVDKPYSFSFSSPWQDDTRAYQKENDSSVYINSMVWPGRYNIYTNGLINGVWTDCTKRSAVVPGEGQYLIYNTIYEDNGNKGTLARLGAFKLLGGTASGEWSPDSVGSFPVIN